MISPEFLNQFNQLAEQQAPDPAGKVSAEVARINAILQQPTGSVREAFAALREIRLNLSRARACQSLSRSLRPLIREEMKKLSSIQEVSEETLSPEKGVERKRVTEEALVESPEKKRRVEEPVYPLPVLLACGKAYEDPVASISEEGIESFYQDATEKAVRYLEKLLTQGFPGGTHLTLTILLEKMQHDKEKDLDLMRIFIQEKEVHVKNWGVARKSLI